ncbi:MAG: hypothetical protein NVSMB57_14870 [Actinomycetota bacterium]
MSERKGEQKPGTVQVKLLVPGHHSMVSLLGTRDEMLKIVESAFDSDIVVRGNEITVTGEPADAQKAVTLFEEMIALLENGNVLTHEMLGQSIEMIRGLTGQTARPSHVFGDSVLTYRGKAIRPKTLGQKKYVDSIRRSTIVFGVGPAGTGKTYLAMAMAVKALLDKEVSRLILTRPAVEAGEKLGYLPGTLSEKIDPYMRPLYDALYEMMDAEALARLTQRGTVEVSPLAYMRGRAQPTTTNVLTPWGWKQIGSLEAGDLVVGSDGLPTPVLGVFPQGRKRVFRVSTQDGASTLACGEHLWAVQTRDDGRWGKPRRVLQTQDMNDQLRAGRRHRFELPLVGQVWFAPQDIPMDPYALGLLLGDGRITGSTSSSLSTADPERVRTVVEAGGRGGVAVANPVPAVLQELELSGTRSATKFVPSMYLYNSPDIRLALLQGLLDSDGGEVIQAGLTVGVQYTTTSPRLSDDVVFLVQSLGGVAYRHRGDAQVIDIRLPNGLAPFRLGRKAEAWARAGVGRPVRFIDSIEPEGKADTVCISVGAEDSLYVTEDFLVTHNTLNDSFIILDEAQNTTPEQMKMFLTRLGFGSKVVVTGDVSQIDLPSGQSSGLNVVREILTGIEGLEFVYLTSKDVVRHKIVQDIVEAYRTFDESHQPLH